MCIMGWASWHSRGLGPAPRVPPRPAPPPNPARTDIMADQPGAPAVNRAAAKQVFLVFLIFARTSLTMRFGFSVAAALDARQLIRGCSITSPVKDLSHPRFRCFYHMACRIHALFTWCALVAYSGSWLIAQLVQTQKWRRLWSCAQKLLLTLVYLNCI